MNKSIILLISLILLTTAVQSSWIRNLANEDQLKSGLAENNNKVWIIFRGNVDEKTVENVAQVFKGMFQVAELDSKSQQTSLEVISDDRENPRKFNGEFTVDNIVKFALQNVDKVIEARSEVAKALKANQQFQKKQAERATKEWEDQQNLRKKSDTIVLNADNWNTFVNGRQAWVINFYESNCSACIELNKDWELISTALKGKAKVAKMNITEAGNSVYEEQIQLSKYPSVRFYKSGPKKVSEFAQFQGVHKRFSIQEWLTSKLEQKTTDVQIPSLNKQNYETLCKASKNTCIVVFLENDDSQALKKISQLSLKHLKKPITFLVSKKGEQDSFAKQVQVSSYPDTVMIYCKQKKLWRMGGLNFDDINAAIEQISMGNRNGFTKYKFEEQLK